MTTPAQVWLVHMSTSHWLESEGWGTARADECLRRIVRFRLMGVTVAVGHCRARPRAVHRRVPDTQGRTSTRGEVFLEESFSINPLTAPFQGPTSVLRLCAPLWRKANASSPLFADHSGSRQTHSFLLL